MKSIQYYPSPAALQPFADLYISWAPEAQKSTVSLMKTKTEAEDPPKRRALVNIPNFLLEQCKCFTLRDECEMEIAQSLQRLKSHFKPAQIKMKQDNLPRLKTPDRSKRKCNSLEEGNTSRSFKWVLQCVMFYIQH